MKIRYIGNPKDLETIKEKLNNEETTFVFKGEEYILKKVDYTPESFIVLKDNNYKIIPLEEVIYIESYDHTILCHTKEDTYELEDKLYEIEEMYRDLGFIRIAKSYIVNKSHIKLIIPEFNSKYSIVLKNNQKLQVTRHYLYDFKKAIGLKVK